MIRFDDFALVIEVALRYEHFGILPISSVKVNRVNVHLY